MGTDPTGRYESQTILVGYHDVEEEHSEACPNQGSISTLSSRRSPGHKASPLLSEIIELRKEVEILWN